jgi:Sugar (and other) transporter
LCILGGMLEAPVLTYVAEVSTPKLRGILAATGSFCIILGIFSQFLMGLYLAWRTITLVSTIAPILAIIFLFFVPESPHWLILKKRDDEAKRSLMWLRGWHKTFDGVKQEYDDLHRSLTTHDTTGSNEGGESLLKAFTRRTFIIPYFICSLGFFIGHFSGMTTLQTYAVPIFAQLKAPIDKYFATMLLGIVELIGTGLCVLLVRFVGKRKLTFFSTFGCSFCFFSTAIYAFFIEDLPGEIPKNNVIANITLKIVDFVNETTTQITEIMTSTESGVALTTEFVSQLQASPLEYNETSSTVADLHSNQHSWIPLTLLLASALLSHSGIRLLPWMLIGEVYPAKIRGISSGITGGTSYVFGFLANKLFLTMVSALTLQGTFLLYSCVSAVGCIILFIFLPGE